MRLVLSIIIAFFWLCSAAVGQQIVVDGSTATSVTQNADQSLHIDVAPASADGVSLNRYERFSVGAAGVELDNQTIRADAIVNEVTGALPSSITGQLSVLGDAADVVIANPNGVSVSGGGFQNIRELTLATGQAQLEANGEVTLSVSDGAIDIGPDGLSAAATRARLVSKTLRVEGEIELAGGELESIQAASTMTIAGNGGAVSTSSLSGVAVELNSSAFLRAGSIRMIATGEGPGVKLSGGMASAEDITISATGAVAASGLEANADRHASIRGQSVVVRQSTFGSATGAVQIDATGGDLTLSDSNLSGEVRNFGDFASLGAVTLSATGRLAVSGGRLDGHADDVVASAGGDLTADSSSVASSTDIRFSSSGRIALDGVEGQAGEGLRLLSTGDSSVKDSALRASSELIVDAGAITVQSSAGQRSELNATDGGLLLISRDGDVENSGGLIEGERRTPGLADSLGGVTILSAGNIINESLDGDRLGVVFSRGDALVIRATGDVENKTARLLSNFNVEIDADGRFLNETQTTGAAGGIFVRRYQDGAPRWWTLFTRRRRVTEYNADFGDFFIDGERALTTSAGGSVIINAGSIANFGADISGVDVSLNASGDVSNEGRRVGNFFFIERCVLLCESFGAGGAQSIGGAFSASQQLNISAGGAFVSIGGSATSGDDLTINATTLSVEPLPILLLLQRPAGLRSWFGGGGDVYWFVETPGSSSFASINGTITANAVAGGAVFRGADFFAPAGLNLDPDADIVAAPDVFSSFGRQDGGVFSGVVREAEQ